MQVYFSTYKEAEDHLKENTAPKLADHNFCRVKRSDAKEQNLPVGMHTKKNYVINSVGKKIYYKEVYCTISRIDKNGKKVLKYFSRSYGLRRTIEKAVLLLERQKTLYLSEYYGGGK